MSRLLNELLLSFTEVGPKPELTLMTALFEGTVYRECHKTEEEKQNEKK